MNCANTVKGAGRSLFDFPAIPGGDGAECPDRRLYLSSLPFSREAIDIDFSQIVRPRLVTEVLRCCTVASSGERPGDEFYCGLSIGKRIECLIVIATRGGKDELEGVARCLNKRCRQEMEIRLGLGELTALEKKVEGAEDIKFFFDDKAIGLRRATGADQLRLLESAPKEHAEAVEALVSILTDNPSGGSGCLPTPLPESCIQAVEDAINEFDPLVNFTLTVKCPFCATKGMYEVDLEELSLRRIERVQREFIHALHHLARGYNWSEEEIFSIPVWRLEKYLALLDREAVL